MEIGTFTKDEEGRIYERCYTIFSADSGASQFEQTIRIVSPDTYSWKVWVGSDDNRMLIMDGVYDRVD